MISPVEHSGATEIYALVNSLAKKFEVRRTDLLAERLKVVNEFSQGNIDFNKATENIRTAKWKVELPKNLLERRVEMIGGGTRAEVVNGLNSGAKSFVVDLYNLTASNATAIERAHRTIERAANLDLAYLPNDGGRIRINPGTLCRLMVVPRPLIITDSSMGSDQEPVAASFIDVARIVLNSGQTMVDRQGGVYFYLRDVRSHLEARLWNDLFVALEQEMNWIRGTIRATVFIDSISGGLEAEEILFELMHHAAGMSLDPQGYAADHIALFSGADRHTLPDREKIGLNAPFLRALSLYTITICHKRGCHAIGPVSFVLPSRTKDKVKTDYLNMLADKDREAIDGYDGTLVVHADTVTPTVVEFNKSMPLANQLAYIRTDVTTPADLIRRPEGAISVDSLLSIIRTTIRNMVERQDGKGWIVQGSRIHDRSSIRLSLRLLWQWNKSEFGKVTNSGLEIHEDLLKYLFKKEGEKMYSTSPDAVKQHATAAIATILEQVNGDAMPDAPVL